MDFSKWPTLIREEETPLDVVIVESKTEENSEAPSSTLSHPTVCQL